MKLDPIATEKQARWVIFFASICLVFLGGMNFRLYFRQVGISTLSMAFAGGLGGLAGVFVIEGPNIEVSPRGINFLRFFQGQIIGLSVVLFLFTLSNAIHLLFLLAMIFLISGIINVGIGLKCKSYLTWFKHLTSIKGVVTVFSCLFILTALVEMNMFTYTLFYSLVLELEGISYIMFCITFPVSHDA